MEGGRGVGTASPKLRPEIRTSHVFCGKFYIGLAAAKNKSTSLIIKCLLEKAFRISELSSDYFRELRGILPQLLTFFCAMVSQVRRTWGKFHLYLREKRVVEIDRKLVLFLKLTGYNKYIYTFNDFFIGEETVSVIKAVKGLEA